MISARKFILIIFALITISPTFSKTIYAALPAARSATVSDDVFLGGNYIELGISKYGSFGTDQNKPDGFFGTAVRNTIGMSSDLDGFDTGSDWRMDFFMPGTQEERWSVGYTIGESQTTAANAKKVGTVQISDNTVTDQSDGDLLKAISEGTLNSNLKITQIISFNVSDKFFRNTITLQNISEDTVLESVRYMRSFDPDNTVDQGGNYETKNTIVYTHEAGDGKAVVIADTSNNSSDPVYLGTGGAEGGTRSPILFYSSDERAKVNYHSSLTPGTVYASSAYDSTKNKGSSENRDGAISIAFDVGTLNAGESETIIYYTSLDERDFSEVEQEIEQDEAKNATFSEISSNINDTSATITWTTDVEASSQIEYGFVPGYGFTTNLINTDPMVKEHEITISDLKPCARYFYRTVAKTAEDVTSYSEQKTFTTEGCALSSIEFGSEENIDTTGGEIELINEDTTITITAPENFYSEAASFQINKLSTTGITFPTNKYLINGNLFDFIAISENEENITNFDNNVTVVIEYGEDVENEYLESTLDLFKYIGGNWIAQNCVVNTNLNTLTCSLPSFSVYSVLGEKPNTNIDEDEDDDDDDDDKDKDKKKKKNKKKDTVTVAKSIQYTNTYTGKTSAKNTPLADTCTYTVTSGDNLWDIAFKVYGDGAFYNNLVELNINKYPDILNYLEVGWELNLNCNDKEKELEINLVEDENTILHDVFVKILQKGKPIKGVSVELHSDPKYGVTNDKGEVLFKDVEKGEHTLKLDYNGYKEEKKLVVDGDEKEYNISIEIELTKQANIPIWIWIVISLLALSLLFILLKNRRKQKE